MGDGTLMCFTANAPAGLSRAVHAWTTANAPEPSMPPCTYASSNVPDETNRGLTNPYVCGRSAEACVRPCASPRGASGDSPGEPGELSDLSEPGELGRWCLSGERRFNGDTRSEARVSYHNACMPVVKVTTFV